MKIITTIIVSLMILCLCACGNSATDVTEAPIGGVTEETENTTEAVTESQETAEPTVSEETTPSFSPEKLSVWGVPEPSFAYEYLGYMEIAKGPDQIPQLYYRGSADYSTIWAYAQTLADAGWNDYVDDPGENTTFAFSGEMGDYKIFIRRDEDNTVIIRVRDLSVLAVWDDEFSTYIVPAYGDYGTYGENDFTLGTL